MSGSGLDPNISEAAALYQAKRVANVRGVTVQLIYELIDQHAFRQSYFFFDVRLVNVLEINLALDAITKAQVKMVE